MHCGRVNCICTHTEGCEKGFISVRYPDRKEINTKEGKKVVETWYDGVLFCPTCDPERAFIQTHARSREEFFHKLQERSKFKATENYEKSEESKTRTL